MSGFSVEFCQRVLAGHSEPIKTAVETGTYKGETTEKLAKVFDHVHTVELSDEWHAAGEWLDDIGVQRHKGRSSQVVPRLTEEIRGPALWYLDAHWFDAPGVASEEPLPTFDELAAIANRKQNDIVIVDDVHAFGRFSGWESMTVSRLLRAADGLVQDYWIEFDKLIIRYGYATKAWWRAKPVSVIVPAYGCPDVTLQCLDALEAAKCALINVIVVDDASPTGREQVRDRLRTMTAPTLWVQQVDHKGHSEAINAGLHLATGHPLLLNNDCFVTPGCIESLFWQIEHREKLAAVVPLTSGGGVASIFRGRRKQRFRSMHGKTDLVWLGDEIRRLTSEHEFSNAGRMVPFFCSLHHRDAIKEIGALDHNTFKDGLGSDDDWCLRARRKGWRLGFCADAFARHLGGTTFKRMRIRRDDRAARRRFRKKAIRTR